jgi:hypothetical protein
MALRNYTIADWNPWAHNLNVQGLKGGNQAEYYLTRQTPTGYENYRDPIFNVSNPDYAARITSGFGKPTAAGATAWSSQEPLAAFYSPTGSNWQAINEGMLSNPTIAQAVMRGAASGLGAGAFGALRAKIPAAVTQGITGSQHALAPEILSKMWK